MTPADTTREKRIDDRPSQPTVAVRVRQPMAELDLAVVFDRYPAAIMDHIRDRAGRPIGPLFGRYHTFGPEVVDVEIGFPVETPLPGLAALADLPEGEVGASELPAGPVAVMTHAGPYDGLRGAYDALHDWIHAQPGYDDGPGPWESYVVDPGSTSDPAELRTELCWPLRRV
jgi:effector-binding domain-containing protein